MKSRCPTCDELVVIRDTGIAQRAGRSSRWWLVLPHDDKRTGRACDGSGALV